MVKGGPNWIRTQMFDVVGKAGDPAKASSSALRQMLQALLSERFRLTIHLESRELSGYGVYVEKTGPRLQISKGKEPPRIAGAAPPSPDLFLIVAQNASMRGFARTLSTLGIGPVVDKTTLQDSYDFRLLFARDQAGTATKERPLALAGDNGTGSTLVSALEEQLGLRLVRELVRVQYVVIDSVERPSDN